MSDTYVFCDRYDCLWNDDEYCTRHKIVLVDQTGDELGPDFICESYEPEEEED